LVEDSARELRLPRDPSNVIGFAYAAKDSAQLPRPERCQRAGAPAIQRLRPTTRLDRWLGLTIQGAIVGALLVDDLPFGVMLVVNRQDESGLFVPRESGLRSRRSQPRPWRLPWPGCWHQPSGPAATVARTPGAPALCWGNATASPRARGAVPTQATPRPRRARAWPRPERNTQEAGRARGILWSTLAFCR